MKIDGRFETDDHHGRMIPLGSRVGEKMIFEPIEKKFFAW